MRVRLRGALIAKAHRLSQAGAVRAMLRTGLGAAWTRGAAWRRPHLAPTSAWRDQIAECFDDPAEPEQQGSGSRSTEEGKRPQAGTPGNRPVADQPAADGPGPSRRRRAGFGATAEAARRSAAIASAQRKGFEPGSRPRLEAMADAGGAFRPSRSAFEPSSRPQAGGRSPVLAPRSHSGPAAVQMAARSTAAAALLTWLRATTAARHRRAAGAPLPTPAPTSAELGLRIASAAAANLRRQAGMTVAAGTWDSTATGLAILWNQPLAGAKASPELLRPAADAATGSAPTAPKGGSDAVPPRREEQRQEAPLFMPDSSGPADSGARSKPVDPAGPPPQPHDGALMLRPETPNLHPTGVPTSETMPVPDAAVGVVRGSRDSFSRVQPPQGAPALPPLIPDRVTRPPSYGVGAVILRQGARTEEAETEGMEALAERIRRIMCEDARRHGLSV